MPSVVGGHSGIVPVQLLLAPECPLRGIPLTTIFMPRAPRYREEYFPRFCASPVRTSGIKVSR
jgi:hypothetical protein